jgi:1-acyl-sn-glycerol-3-phosphate acyltransferase
MMTYRIKAGALAAATGVCFLFFWLGSLVLSWVVLPLIGLVLRHRPPPERIRRCQDVVGVGFRLFLGCMRTLRTLVFRPRTVELDLPEGPFVMIANHPTLIDVTAIMAVAPRICCVAKTELFDSVLVGPLLRACGHIEGGGGSLADGAMVIEQAEARLAQGHPVLIFPEGTRSPAGGLRRFKPGAFEIALRAGVPIVPLLLTCEPPTLGKGLAWYALPKKTAIFDLRQLPSVQPEALSGDARGAAAHFHEAFNDMIVAARQESAAATVTPARPPRAAEPQRIARE